MSAPVTVGRSRRPAMLRNILIGLLVLWLVLQGTRYVVGKTMGTDSHDHLASSTVTVVSADRESDGIHVRARLDAPSPDGTSHELKGVIPEQTWAVTHTLWACYPPDKPGNGFLRTPLDPACSDMVSD